ncbi:methyl-accepting chemotaxis protein [Roseateles koreensis]|uniref:Methyl-accepting chemotaxis protein n=1 Tax=Roseateles koreensis TaxID=2987526 RepID=A0ABT5KUB4_9BURK|nr:methyl-accepting chemotaxis protein [Roseateles koreensis]MDC8785948.1 methyl-accepting chemotaxis protein [Roseateles koreensis]
MSISLLSGRTIGHRLGLVLSLVLLISLAGSGLGFWALKRVAEETERTYQVNLSAERLASDWHRNVSGGVTRATAIAVAEDNSLATYFAPMAKASAAQTSELQKQVEALLDTPRERELLSQINTVRTDYIRMRDAIAAAKKAGESDKGRKIFDDEFAPTAKRYLDVLRQLVEMEREQLDTSAKLNSATNERARLGLLAFALCALVTGAALATWLTRSITGPLKEAAKAAQAIAQFDLRQRISVGNSQDETGQLLNAQHTMQQELTRLVRDLRNATDSIGTASHEIATGNLDLSSRTEQTASNLQEAAASMIQLTGTVKHTAEAAVTANQLASSASEVARRGGAVVAQVVSTMEEISTSSRRIGDIIGTIDGIAFQTNILALNAAVEAARAGEQGRGFAVVAAEVRSLAQRSAEAAKEIKTLINASAERVESGTHLVQAAGSTMDDIVASVQRVTDVIAEISAASREQSDDINQINAAVSQLDQMTQQNAALVEESAAAAESLRDQSGRLTQAIGVFKL